MLRAPRIGRTGGKFVDVAGSSCTVCEKQASSMAWQLFLLLSLPHYMLRARPLRYPRTKQTQVHRGLDGDMGMGLNPDPNLKIRAWEKFIHIHT